MGVTRIGVVGASGQQAYVKDLVTGAIALVSVSATGVASEGAFEARLSVLHRGRVLVAADRMIGGLAVLTRRAALLPEGTTYLAETSDSGEDRKSVV